MDLVRDPYSGKMVDRRTGLPVEAAPGNVQPQRVNFMDRLLAGSGVSERIMAAHSMFNPVTALAEAGQQSQLMFDPATTPMGRVAALGGMLTGMAGTVAPMYAASKGAVPTANAMVDALTGINMPGGEFLADEFGGVKMPGQGGITAYHGSPHSFDKFSMDKIGTGEGAQAYGHGLYFAENEGVAKGYRDTLAKSGTDGAQRRLQAAGGDIDAAIASATEKAAKYRAGGADGYAEAVEEDLRFLEKFKQTGEWTPGSMYEVRINANPDDFLDWDKPLDEGVRYDIAQQFRGGMNPMEYELADLLEYNEGMTGQVARQWIGHSLEKGYVPEGVFNDPSGAAAVQADKYLQEAGFPGIKYLDAGSRGAGDGSRNYVVFDENLIEIVKKYGIAGAAAMLGVTAFDVEQAMASAP